LNIYKKGDTVIHRDGNYYTVLEVTGYDCPGYSSEMIKLEEEPNGWRFHNEFKLVTDLRRIKLLKLKERICLQKVM
jgi:hypothetical protein